MANLARKAALALAVTVVATGIGAIGSGTAFADNTGTCTSSDNGAGGDACLYYNSNRAGSRDSDPYVNNYSNPSGTTYTYHGWSGGSNANGAYVKNNAASFENWDTSLHLYVYYNSNQLGAWNAIGPMTWANFLPGLKNQNASQGWSTS